MMSTAAVSDCCGAPVIVASGEEGTNHYVCNECERPCDVEPHVNVWRFGTCVACGAADSWVVVAVPNVATGEQYPQFGVCEECEHHLDLRGMPPFLVAP